MSAPILKKGRSGPVETGQTITKSDKDGVTVVVEGTYSSLKTLGAQRVAQYVPAGYTFISSRLSPTGNGFGELAISCVKYENEGASGFAPVRTTFRIKMAEVQYDLEDHPYLKGTYRDICLKWLATDEAVRVKLENGGVFGLPVPGEVAPAQREKFRVRHVHVVGFLRDCRRVGIESQVAQRERVVRLLGAVLLDARALVLNIIEV